VTLRRARATVVFTALASAALAWLVLADDRGSRCDASLPELLVPLTALLLALAPTVVAWRTAASVWLGLLLTACVVVALTLAFDVGQPYDCFFSTER
jgi:hypothetical protein